MRHFKSNYPALQVTVFILIAFLGAAYIYYTWRSTENEKFDQTRLIARSFVASLPLDELKALDAIPRDIDKPQYQVIKNALKELISVNTKARFAYIFIERKGKIYFIADSEPEESKDYSPPGQEYTETDLSFKQVFKDGKVLLKGQATDRWGTWTSVLIPVKDRLTGKTIAVFGMDFNAKAWFNSTLFEVMESSVLILLTLVAFVLLSQIKTKNKILNDDYAKLLRAQDDLKQQKEEFEMIFNLVPVQIWYKDIHNTFIRVNRLACNYVGLPENEINGHAAEAIFPSFAEKFFKDDLEVFNSHKPKLGIIEQVNSDPVKLKWVHTDKFPVFGKEGELAGLVAFVQDITYRKMTEDALMKSEARLRILVHTIPDLIWMKDTAGVYLGCNTMFERFFGAREADIIGKTDYDFVAPELAEFFCAHDQQAMQAGKPTSNEEWITFADDGHRAFLETIKAPMYDVDGILVGVLGIGRDITQRREAEDKLLESEIKYRAFFENSMDAILLTSPDGKTLSANQAACHMFGYSEEKLIELGRSGVVDTKDPQLAFMLSERTLKQKVRSELTFIRKDGTRFQAEISSTIFKNSEGLERASMIIRDITERVKTQNEIKFQADLLGNVGQSVIATDLQGYVIYWNNAAEKIYGWSAVEAMGQNILNLTPSEQSKEQAVVIMNELSVGKKWSGEFVVKGKDGNKFPAYVTDTPIFDSEGNLTGIIGISNDITERKFAEKALQESEERFRHTFDYASSGICLVGRDGKFLQINNAFKEMIGFDERELKNLTFTDITHPDDFSIGSFHFEKLLNGEIDHISFEKRYIRKDKKIIWAYVSTSLIRDGNQKSKFLITQIIDISERKHTEETLLKLSRVVEQTSGSIIITDRDGVIEYVNHSFEVLTGYSSEEALGKTPALLKSGTNDSKYYEVLWNTILSGEVFSAEIVNKKKNGDLYDEEKTISPIFDKNHIITHFVSTGVDISERKQAEKELIEAKNKAEESDRLKSAFLANMSHEIRTPMNGILGFARLLKEPKLSGEEQQEYLGIIERSGARMLNIINDIVSISKVESGQMEVSIQETNINEQVEYIYSFFKHEAGQNGLQFFFKNSLPFKASIINTDREKVYAILTNLVKNAIKFTHAGIVEFGYNLKSDIEPMEFEFYVKDTGVGINPDHQKFIFERFRQSSESLNRKYEGAGLGLTISRAYVEMLGGRIWVESEPGKGSTFYFTIPCNVKSRPDNYTPIIMSADNTEFHVDTEFSGLKILIVEDDESNRKLITSIVKMFCKTILNAKTGTEAVETCRNNNDINLILMDIKMPEMDGYEATRQIRQFNTKVLIIAQTAFALTGDREKALAAGCDDYVSKPYSKSLLISLVKKHLIM